MAQFFFRSRRRIEGDGFLASFWFMGAAAVVLALWLFWFFAVPVSIYEVSPDARVETSEAVFDIAAPLDGTVKETNLVVGKTVVQGDVLVTFDTSAVLLSLKEAAARHEKALAEAEYAEEERSRWVKLHKADLLSDIDLIKAETEARKLNEAVKACSAEMELLEYRIEKHAIKAPFAGVIGSVAPVKPGSVVKEKDPLGTLVPPGGHKIVAYYLPAAVGRIKPGDPARLKLDGFPWTQYGVVNALVKNVANELVTKGIKVEFDLIPAAPRGIPFQHGLTGAVETLVARKTPAELVLAKAGKFFAPSATSSATGAPQ